MKNYFEYARSLERILDEGMSIKSGAFGAEGGFAEKIASGPFCKNADLELPERYKKCNKRALVFAPHPDDESIISALPLRLMAECGFSVCDAAVTLGSNKSRRSGRRAELESACSYLGWDLRICGDDGFDGISANERAANPEAWRKKAEYIAGLISGENPAAIFAPHKDDWNKTHVGTSLLVGDALSLLGDSYIGLLVSTEYWRPMHSANLLVELSADILGAQMTAISCHLKEVERNPYHVRLAALAIDNVRRGGEVVGGQGSEAPDFKFGAIYNVSERCNGEYSDKFSSAFLSRDTNAIEIFRF